MLQGQATTISVLSAGRELDDSTALKYYDTRMLQCSKCVAVASHTLQAIYQRPLIQLQALLQ